MDQDLQTATSNAVDAVNANNDSAALAGPVPGNIGRQQAPPEAHPQAASQNGDNQMLTGLATNRGNEGNDMMGSVDHSVSRYDQQHQDVGAAQSQHSFNPNAYGMLGGTQQPNVGSMSGLPAMQANGKYDNLLSIYNGTYL